MRMEVSYNHTAMKSICKASSGAVRSSMSAGRVDVRGTSQVARLLGARAEVRVVRAFGVG